MFVGHYGVSYVAKRVDDSIPLWILFVAVQFVDIVWASLVLLGVEKVRIVPGFTATNPLETPPRWVSGSGIDRSWRSGSRPPCCSAAWRSS